MIWNQSNKAANQWESQDWRWTIAREADGSFHVRNGQDWVDTAFESFERASQYAQAVPDCEVKDYLYPG